MLFRDPDKTRLEEKGERQFFRFISFCTFHYFRYVWTLGRGRLRSAGFGQSIAVRRSDMLRSLQYVRYNTTTKVYNFVDYATRPVALLPG